MEFDGTVLMVDEAELIEELIGVGPGEWYGALDQAGRSTRALKAMVWLTLRRARHERDFATLNFDINGLEYGQSGKAPSSDDSSDSTESLSSSDGESDPGNSTD